MRTTTLVILVAVSLGVVAAAGGAAAGGAASTGHDNGIGSNYTVVLPDQADHYPGTQGGAASIWHLAAGGDSFEQTSSPEGLKRMDSLTISNPDIVFGSCSTENTAAFGLDYGNNNSGTTTDEGLLSHRENSAFNEHSIYVDFYGPDSLAGSPVRYKAIDQIVAVQQDCYEMPSEPGWYQINARINGTGYNGNYIDSKDQGEIFSHYFYVCECDSEQAAREKLGPPPSESGGGGDESGGGGGSEPTPTGTPEPTATADPADGSESTATATPESTATATATADASGSDSSTATATPESTATATATANSADGSADGDSGDGATETATATTGAGSGQQGQQNQQGGGPATPTAGAGPGFGLTAALGGVLAAVLLARRRD